MDFRLPELGEGVYEAELVRWLIKPGDVVKRAQALMEVLTDKATMEVATPFTGVIETLHAEPGQQIKIGDVILTYNDLAPSRPESFRPGSKSAGLASETTGSVAAASATAVPRTDNGPVATSAQVKAAPSVRQLAHKLGIDLGTVPGSGPHGRVLLGDLSGLIQRLSSPEAQAEEALPAQKKPPAYDYGKPGTKQKFQGLRRKIAEHMSLAKRTMLTPPTSMNATSPNCSRCANRCGTA